MLLAPALGEQPRGTAEKLAEELGKSLEGTVERVEVAGPGFLNLFLADAWYRRAAGELAEQGERLGRPAGADEVTERINVEFVSANPTGPGDRGERAARGLRRLGRPAARVHRPPRGARVLHQRPRRPDRPASRQSIAARMKGEPVPEDGYEGDYVVELGKSLEQEGVDAGRPRRRLARRGMALMVRQIEETLRRYGVVFDTWSSERALHESGRG